MKRISALLFFAIIAIVACLPVLAAEFENTIRVAGIFGLTGAASPFGKGELDAVNLAIEEWNTKGGIGGKKIVLVAEDHGTDQAKLVSAFKRLVDVEHFQAIIGPTWLDSFQAAIPLAEKAGVLLLTPSAAAESFERRAVGKPIALSTYFVTRKEIAALLKYLADTGKKRIVITYDLDPYFQLLKKIVDDLAPQYGVELSEEIDFPVGETNFRSFFTRLRSKKPDALLFFQQREESVLSFFRQAQELALNVPILAIHDFEGFLKDEKIASTVKSLEFTYFKIADDTFARRFDAKYGYTPILTASNAYDAANMLFEALANGKQTGVQIRDYLLATKFRTVTFGDTEFLPDGSMKESQIGMKRFRDGKIETLN